eukprot:6674899-Prymnesium_polylepis.1
MYNHATRPAGQGRISARAPVLPQAGTARYASKAATQAADVSARWFVQQLRANFLGTPKRSSFGPCGHSCTVRRGQLHCAPTVPQALLSCTLAYDAAALNVTASDIAAAPTPPGTADGEMGFVSIWCCRSTHTSPGSSNASFAAQVRMHGAAHVDGDARGGPESLKTINLDVATSERQRVSESDDEDALLTDSDAVRALDELGTGGKPLERDATKYADGATAALKALDSMVEVATWQQPSDANVLAGTALIALSLQTSRPAGLGQQIPAPAFNSFLGFDGAFRKSGGNASKMLPHRPVLLDSVMGSEIMNTVAKAAETPSRYASRWDKPRIDRVHPLETFLLSEDTDMDDTLGFLVA